MTHCANVVRATALWWDTRASVRCLCGFSTPVMSDHAAQEIAHGHNVHAS